jgi:hypothetical protein
MHWFWDQRTATEHERGFAACAGEVSNGGGGSGALFNAGRRMTSDVWRSGQGLSVQSGRESVRQRPVAGAPQSTIGCGQRSPIRSWADDKRRTVPESSKETLVMPARSRTHGSTGLFAVVGSVVGFSANYVYLNVALIERLAAEADGYPLWSMSQVPFALPGAIAGALVGAGVGVGLRRYLEGRSLPDAAQHGATRCCS